MKQREVIRSIHAARWERSRHNEFITYTTAAPVAATAATATTISSMCTFAEEHARIQQRKGAANI